ncbi:MAG: glycosyltransferase family 4 protein [Patescibacteria group bacterium]
MSHGQSPLVIVCTTAYLPAIGGAELAIYEIAKRSPALRFLIVTSRFSRKVPKHEKTGNIEVSRVGFGIGLDKWFLPLWGGFIAFWRARREPKALLWGMMVSQGTIAALVVKTLSPRIPFVLTLQEGDAPDYLQRGRGGLIWFFWKRALKRANQVTAISKYLQGLASEAGRSDVHLVPNGVDVESFSKRDEDATHAIRAKHGISDSDIVILSVSRLVIKNGLNDLIGAFAIFLRTHSNAKLLLVGEGSERSKLETLVKNDGVADRVIFVGAVAPRDIVPYFHAAQVFVRPSLSEGMGNVFIEAMAAGIPVVATGVGGIADFVKDGQTGIIVSVGDVQNIAEGIARVVSDPDLQKNLTHNAFAMVERRYEWDLIAKQMNQIFTETLL